MTPIELKTARKQLGLSQAGLAHALGLSEKHGLTTVGRYERGTREIPGPVVLAMKWLEHVRSADEQSRSDRPR